MDRVRAASTVKELQRCRDIAVRLKEKGRSLTVDDAYFIQRFIQEQTAPIISLRTLCRQAEQVTSASTATTVQLCSVARNNAAHERSDSNRQHPKDSTSEALGVDLTSLDEFPPMSSLPEKRSKHRELDKSKHRELDKPKRRIAPTRLRPQHVNSEFPLRNWEEPVYHHAFTNAGTMPCLDLRQAMKEDYCRIQKEITSQRRHHTTRKGRAATTVYEEQNCNGRSKGSVEGSEDAAATMLAPLPAVTSSLSNECLHISDISDPQLFNQIADIYSEAMNGLLIPSVVSEMHFLLQLLTLTLPPVPAQTLQQATAMVIFKTASDCIYFSLSMIDRVKVYFVNLDRSTLQLLSGNTRIIKFSPHLAEFFEAKQERDKVDEVLMSQGYLVGPGVQFQENTDNSNNFPDIKAFHAFKKQRDSFYSVLRSWEKHHDDPKWTMKDQLGEKIHVIIKVHGKICSCSYFAKLFLKQLVESCYYSHNAGSGFIHGLSGKLTKMDPNRLIKLTKRFYTPSSGNSSCNPSFSQTEEFFSEFISIADSYIFNHHLMLVLSQEIARLHEASVSAPTDGRKFFEILHTLCIMAKFLGFLEFLPHTLPTSLSPPGNRTFLLDLKQCLHDAQLKGHLCLTVPWVVQYLSMMDLQAAEVESCHSTLAATIDVYRSLAVSAAKFTSRAWYLVVCVLGWFYEIPNFPLALFSKHLMGSSSTSSVVFGSMPNSLDCQLPVTTDILYWCCPFLYDIHSPLVEFAAGQQTKSTSKKKIKPLSTAIESADKSPFQDVEVYLVASFFRAHHPHVKQMCEIVANRLFHSVQVHVETCVIMKYVEMASNQCMKWLQEKSAQGREMQMKLEGERFVDALISTANKSLSFEIEDYTSSLCRDHCKTTLDILLGESVSSEVASTAGIITAKLCMAKCLKWIKLKVQAKLAEDVMKVYWKGCRGLLIHLETLYSSEVTSSGSLEPDKYGSCPQVHQKSMNFNYLQFSSEILQFKGACDELLLSSAHIITPAKYEDLLTSVSSLIGILQSRAYILPGVPCPPQVVMMTLMGYLEFSMDLVAHLVSQGPCMKLNQSGCGLMDKLIEGWKLCRELKVEVCASKLLSATTFENYMKSDAQNGETWQSLAHVLALLVCNAIVSSAAIEGLWLCRWHQLKKNLTKFEAFLEAVSVFVSQWHLLSHTAKDCDKALFIPFHFVRLMYIVLQYSDRQSNSPVSSEIYSMYVPHGWKFLFLP